MTLSCPSCASENVNVLELGDEEPRHYIGDGCELLADDHPQVREHGLAALQSLARAVYTLYECEDCDEQFTEDECA